MSSDFSRAFGDDFSAVRVQHDPASEDVAQRIGAGAFTVGERIYMGRGGRSPRRAADLLVHELVHVQQNRMRRDGGIGRVLLQEVTPRPETEIREHIALLDVEDARGDRLLDEELRPEVLRLIAAGEKQAALELVSQTLSLRLLHLFDDPMVELEVRDFEDPEESRETAAKVKYHKETLDWLEADFESYVRGQRKGTDKEALAVGWVGSVRRRGIPPDLQKLTVRVPPNRVTAAELNSLVSTLYHEAVHVFQLQKDYLRTFPHAIGLDLEKLTGVKLRRLLDLLKPSGDLRAELAALEIGAYYEAAQLTMTSMVVLTASQAASRLALLSDLWKRTTPEFKKAYEIDFWGAYGYALFSFHASIRKDLDEVRDKHQKANIYASALAILRAMPGGRLAAEPLREEAQKRAGLASSAYIRIEMALAQYQNARDMAEDELPERFFTDFVNYEYRFGFPGLIDAWKKEARAAKEELGTMRRASEPQWMVDFRAEDARQKKPLGEGGIWEIHFSGNVSESPAGVFVAEVAEEIKALGSCVSKVLVTGHSDSTGSRSRREAIALERAEFLTKLLVEAGIPKGAIETKGVGSREPKVRETKDNIEFARRQNRRAVIELVMVANCIP